MATTIRPIFARPVEHISIGTDFTVAGVPCTVPTGVYANVLALFRAFATAAGDWVDDIRMSDDLKLEFQAGETGVITFANLTLAGTFGYSGAILNVTDTEWETAAQTPLYIWYPERQKADQGVFRKSPKDQFAGEKSLAGNLSGIATGSTKYYRSMEFVNELGTRLSEELATTTYEAARCLDIFFQGSISVAATRSTHPSPKGFWYYDDVNAFIADCKPTGTEWGDAGGIYFGRTAVPSVYVFCHFDPLGLSTWTGSPTFVVSRLRYSVEISFTTANPGTFL